ncbi:hypothetical protein EVAR_53079_1 [Eumeta japonica]|uniref:Uncharacterized protein n=1 Tax=Eumeta variegata TaxID=151549 RepID=A0A4C1YW93_EUMVA|nr:hypothetical protein EVAR_53079_1 [Eumeta japonica]
MYDVPTLRPCWRFCARRIPPPKRVHEVHQASRDSVAPIDEYEYMSRPSNRFIYEKLHYQLGYIKMDVMNTNEEHCITNDYVLEESNTDLCCNESYSSNMESQEQLGNEFDNDFETASDEDDLKIDLQKSFPGCYKSDQSYSSSTYSEITNEELQASALCQFMDILNDLDEVLDKSLLACLDDSTKFSDSDEDDVICKSNFNSDDNTYLNNMGHSSSRDDSTQVILSNSSDSPQSTSVSEEQIVSQCERPRILNLGRSKSFTSLTTDCREPLTFSVAQTSTDNDEVRSSMRRLDPILLPAITTQEQLTLPVILFLEHHVNMRPTSAPIQLQVTATNLTGDVTSGPLIVGRRTLLMNRALSSPSPGNVALNGDWRNTMNSAARSTSASSSSSESLSGLPPLQPTVLPEER